jgi:hypothetical protein
MDSATTQAMIGALLGINTLLLTILLKKQSDTVQQITCRERRATCAGGDLLHHSHEGLDPDSRVILTRVAK